MSIESFIPEMKQVMEQYFLLLNGKNKLKKFLSLDSEGTVAGIRAYKTDVLFHWLMLYSATLNEIQLGNAGIPLKIVGSVVDFNQRFANNFRLGSNPTLYEGAMKIEGGHVYFSPYGFEWKQLAEV